MRAYRAARRARTGRMRQEELKQVPATAGRLSLYTRKGSWHRRLLRHLFKFKSRLRETSNPVLTFQFLSSDERLAGFIPAKVDRPP